MQRLKNSRRYAAALVLIISGIVSALAGSAGTGSAAPGITFTFEPLIGTSNNEVPKVSYGKGIGFHLFIQNNGTNSTPQTSSVTVTSDLAKYDTKDGGAAATFNGTTPVQCDASLTNEKQMVCPLPTGTLQPGDKFEAFFRFIAPTSDETTKTSVSTTATLSTTAQTVGGKKNNGSSLGTGTLPTTLVSDTTIDNAYLRQNEPASTVGAFTSTHPQNFSLTTPPGLLNGAFGVAVGIQDKVGKPNDLCVGLLNSCTILTVPAAKLAESPPGTPFPGNPFYTGVATAPYTWTMDAKYTGGFTLTGVLHVDDNGVSQQVPSCASLVTVTNPTGNPTAAAPLCYDHLTQDKPNKLLHADGRGIENGGLGWN
jgi:hypothetical protein